MSSKNIFPCHRVVSRDTLYMTPIERCLIPLSKLLRLPLTIMQLPVNSIRLCCEDTRLLFSTAPLWTWKIPLWRCTTPYKYFTTPFDFNTTPSGLIWLPWTWFDSHVKIHYTLLKIYDSFVKMCDSLPKLHDFLISRRYIYKNILENITILAGDLGVQGLTDDDDYLLAIKNKNHHITKYNIIIIINIIHYHKLS